MGNMDEFLNSNTVILVCILNIDRIYPSQKNVANEKMCCPSKLISGRMCECS